MSDTQGASMTDKPKFSSVPICPMCNGAMTAEKNQVSCEVCRFGVPICDNPNMAKDFVEYEFDEPESLGIPKGIYYNEDYVKGMRKEIADLKYLLNAINSRVMPGEMDSVESLRSIIAENERLKEELRSVSYHPCPQCGYIGCARGRKACDAEIDKLRKALEVGKSALKTLVGHEPFSGLIPNVASDALAEIDRIEGTKNA